MGISEIAALIIVLLTIGVSIYKNSQKASMLKAVIMGVEDGFKITPKIVKTAIARRANELGVSKVLYNLVQKFTT